MSLVKTSPIIAIATGNGNAGVGIVRISGEEEEVKALFQKMFPGKEIKPRYAELLPIRDTQGQILDTGIVIYFRAPFSYTGESVLELQVHGGRVLLNWIVQEVLIFGKEFGLRQALPGEFTERAFLNGKIDLVQAEAVADLIEANSRNAAKAASRSLTGEFSNKVNALNDALINLRVEVEAILDFPEEEIDFLSEYQSQEKLEDIQNRLESVLDSARQGEILRDGLRVALVGETNVGKSSLLNYLAGEEIAIVSDIAGTTRDKIQTDLIISGVPFHFVDTAGIRETEDRIEQIGIERTKQEISKADVILEIRDIRDQQNKNKDSMQTALKMIKGKDVPIITVLNKVDLISTPLPNTKDVSRGTIIETSAVTGKGMQELKSELLKLAGFSENQSIYMARERHIHNLLNVKESLKRAASYLNSTSPQLELFAEELRGASDELGEITGKISSDDLLGKIFSGFCIGK